MRILKRRVFAGVLLACAVPTLAVDFYEIPSSGNPSDPYQAYNYNPTPDEFAVIDWENIYAPPYATWSATPYYQNTNTPGTPTASDDIRFNMITARYNVGAAHNIQANNLYIGDSYWPLAWGTYATTYSIQETRQEGGTVTVNTYNMGRPAGEFVTPSMAVHSKWNIRAGTLNIGDLRQLNNDQTNTTALGRGLTAGIISNESSSALDASTVNINDIYLNDTWTYLHMNGGYWNINGEIEQQGNLIAILMGIKTQPADPLNPNAAKLTIKWSTLLDMIDHGQLFTRHTGYGGRFRPGSEWQMPNPVGTDPVRLTNPFNATHLITRDNMYSEMVITNLGNDMVMVRVPEPATLGLLALAGLLVARRRWA